MTLETDMMDTATSHETVSTLTGLADEAFVKGDRDVCICAIEAVYAHFDKMIVHEFDVTKYRSKIAWLIYKIGIVTAATCNFGKCFQTLNTTPPCSDRFTPKSTAAMVRPPQSLNTAHALEESYRILGDTSPEWLITPTAGKADPLA